ncbi:MAG: outer membrane protein assembly factor BamA [Elusimicrobia bacterium]|nr:outer membrane protein assembly factor BamA [Elusimicrobiota bacterium]
MVPTKNSSDPLPYSTSTTKAPAPQASSATKEDRWVVGDIVIQGNKNVKTNVIRGQIRARKGESYSRTNINSDVQAILGLGGFERAIVEIETIPGETIPSEFQNLTASTQPIRIKYLVTEKPVIRKISFVGQKQVYKSTLLDAMTLKTKDPLDEAKLKEDVNKMLDTYHNKGFIDAKIEFEMIPPDKSNQVEVTFKVAEGPKAKIADVRLEGLSAFPPKKLIKQMTNRPKKVYKPKEWVADLKKIERYYKTRGYTDFEILESTLTYTPERTQIFITFKLHEGVQALFGNTSFSGNTVYSSKELAEQLTYRPGKIFDQEKFEESIAMIQEKYAEKGYLRARVAPLKQLNPQTHFTDITFQISEGNVIYVDHIDVEGNHATKTYVLRREITQKEGGPFNSKKIAKSQEKLFNLGFLDEVRPDILNTADPDKVDLVFDITEGKPGMLTAGAGFSSLDGLVGTLSLSHLNLLGRGYRTSVQWQFGSRVQDYSVSWTTPWIHNSPTSLGLDLFNTRRLRPFSTASTAFTDKRTGGRVRVGPRFQDDKYQLSVSYAFQRVTVANVEDQFLASLPPGTSDSSSIGIEFARDTRDYVWDPTRGSKHAISYELSGGPLSGDIHFFRPGLSNNLNFKLFSIGDYPFVLSFTHRFGFVQQFGRTDSIPVFERYFMGGQDTIRGYNATGQIGPSFGGKVYDVVNVEYKFPLARERRRTIVQGAFFFDIGNSWDNFRSTTLQIGSREDQLKTGAGFGIRFVTPAFPIRLDWGYGFNHKSGEQQAQIYFTLGNIGF